MTIDTAIIGGTGVGSLLTGLDGKSLFVPTRYGLVKGRLVQQNGANIFAIQRHSAGHSVAPHHVKYLAIGEALRLLGVSACFSTAAVGSLNPNWRVGQLVTCSDFVDLTGRNLTIFDAEVSHTDFSRPFDAGLNAALQTAAVKLGLELSEGGVYVNTNGPRYETPHEIEMIRRFGGNLVGMTAASEAVALRESGVPYACIAVVTNAAAGVEDGELNHFDVGDQMRKRGRQILELLLLTARSLVAK